MPGTNHRSTTPEKAPTAPVPEWILWVSFVIPAALALYLVIDGRKAESMSTVSALGLIGMLIVWALFIISFVVFRTLERGQAAQAASMRQMEELTRSMRHMVEHGALSDDARRVLNRQRERELLRAAIQEDIDRNDWDAASVLCKELAERFGYRSDAEEFRYKIETARFETMDRQVRDAISLLDGLIIQRRWDGAYQEAAKIGRLFPDSPRVEGLRDRVLHAKQAYKQELERQFFVAAQEDRVEDAMEHMKELDGYLTEAEAAPLRELARGVIGKARENLGAQFKLAVQDRRWPEAAYVGDRIISEFPNTRMAAEVRSIIDSIRTKAAAMAG